jgi:uncharacterized protein YndB with AHSA1/START domain
LGREFEQRKEVEVEATPQQVWEAVATGPGLDSWFMGRSEVEPGEGGAVRTDLGGFVLESKVTAWEPPRRFAHRGIEAENGRFIAYEFLIEGRDAGSTVLRLVASGFLPGDDWEAEYEAMTRGGDLYFHTLVQYVSYFPARTGTAVSASGPAVADWGHAWALLGGALGLTGTATPGDRVRFTPDGLPPVEGVFDFVNPAAVGIRTNDALYRFVRGFQGGMVIGHHVFSAGVDREQAERAWRAWLSRLFA